MSNEYWILYDPKNKTQTEQLSTEQAQFSLMKMKTKEIDNFLIFKSQWDKWKKLREFLTSDNSPFMSTFFGKSNSIADEPDAPSSIPMKPVDKETEKKFKLRSPMLHWKKLTSEKCLLPVKLNLMANSSAPN